MSEFFTHSTKDVIQKIGILNGHIKVPLEPVPFVFSDLRQYQPNDYTYVYFSERDCLIIVISSMCLMIFMALNFINGALETYNY